ncbi:MAG TPA: hypothetical protein VHB68_08645 [Steroidobacteraceae bacterium]|nr:hypothetical protein [Steroidobacteraceae bacterium]
MLEKSGRKRVHGGVRGRARGMGHGAMVLVLAATLAGCGHLPSWPWRHKPTPPPPEVHELDETSDAGTAVSFPQYWMRNTLVVDLQGATGSGGIVLKPRAGTTWPVRVAFKVMPGSIGVLEVRAAQRTVLPVTTQGAKPVVLELSPGIYTPKSPQIAVSWGYNTAPTT